MLEQLDDREQQIICYRYGLDSDRGPMTFKEVGSALGVSKERIRQLANRAIAKLRQVAAEQGLEEPEDRPAHEPRFVGRPGRGDCRLVMAK